METVHVLCLGRFSENQLERLRAVSNRLQVEQIPTQDFASIGGPLTRAEVLYTFGLPASLEQVPRLRWVQLSSAGAEHLAGHPVMAARHIHITTTSGIHAGPMAEYVMAVMLAWARRLPTTLELQRRREWPKGRWNVLRSLELRDATLGIVGYGSIGREIARLASAFGMRVLALKRHPEERLDRGYIEPGLGDPEGRLPARWYAPEELHAMLAECDYVVLTVPLTPATRGLINADALRAMKPSALLINVARGDIVVEQDLLQALREKWIAGAALDVFSKEPLPADHPLWELDNVILTPHISAITDRYEERAARLFAENLRRYLAGEPLLNEINREEGY